MKVAIYCIVAFSMLENLGASDLFFDENSGEIKKAKYELSVSRFDFAKQNRVMPGVTLSINNVLLEKLNMAFTCARTLSKASAKLIQITPMETVLYTSLSYRF